MAASQSEGERSESADELPPQLRRFVVSRDDGEVVGVAEAAVRLGVSRTTVCEWADKNVLIAWHSTRSGLDIPAGQIVGPGRVVPGLAEVVKVVESPQLAWAFLSQEWPFDDGVALPLERLNAGNLDEVLAAAAGFGTTFT